MERLIIDIPEKKSKLVKQLLAELGVLIKEERAGLSSYQKKLLQVSVWTEEELKIFDETKKAFNDLKPQEW